MLAQVGHLRAAQRTRPRTGAISTPRPDLHDFGHSDIALPDKAGRVAPIDGEPDFDCSSVRGQFEAHAEGAGSWWLSHAAAAAFALTPDLTPIPSRHLRSAAARSGIAALTAPSSGPYHRIRYAAPARSGIISPPRPATYRSDAPGRTPGYNFPEQRASSAERAVDCSGSANGHLTSPRNGYLTFRKTEFGGPPLKRGTPAARGSNGRLTLDKDIERSYPFRPVNTPHHSPPDRGVLPLPSIRPTACSVPTSSSTERTRTEARLTTYQALIAIRWRISGQRARR
jgi:hypothetical protein